MKGSSKARRRTRSRPAGTILIRGGLALTLDDQRRAGRLDLLIEDRRIAALGADLSPRGVGLVIDADGRLVMPGLIQGHTQVAQTLFRGQGDGDDAETWLRERIIPREAALRAAGARAAARLGFAELLLGGTTAVLDTAPVRYADVLFEEAERWGLRYHGGRVILDAARGLPASLRESADEALAASRASCDRWHRQAGDRLRYAFTLHSPLWCSEAAVRGAASAARAAGARLQLQLAQTTDEGELVRERTGKSAVAWLAELGALGPELVVSHGVWLTAAERAQLGQAGAHLVHTPASDLKLGVGIARLPEWLAEGLSVSLGCASPAANDTLDAFAELRLAALVHRARRGPGAVSGEQILHLATRGGAQALGYDDLGALAVGWRADVILVELGVLRRESASDELAARVVHGAQAADVQTVIVDGEVLVRDRRPLRFDRDRVVAAAQVQAAALTDRAT